MTIERTWYCDAAGCERHVGGMSRRPAAGFLTVTGDQIQMGVRHFCSWDCVLKYAATQEPMEIIPFHDGRSEDTA